MARIKNKTKPDKYRISGVIEETEFLEIEKLVGQGQYYNFSDFIKQSTKRELQRNKLTEKKR